MNTTEMKMLRWIQGQTRNDHIRNVTIRTHIKPINTFLMTKDKINHKSQSTQCIAYYIIASTDVFINVVLIVGNTMQFICLIVYIAR